MSADSARYLSFTTTMRRILDLERQGKNGVEIAKLMEVSTPRISTLRNTAAYIYQRDLEMLAPVKTTKVKQNELANEVKKIRREVIRENIEKQLDPVIQALKASALPAAQEIIRLSVMAEKEETRLAAGKEVLDRSGYMPEKKVISRTIELSGEDADRISESVKYVETRTLETIL